MQVLLDGRPIEASGNTLAAALEAGRTAAMPLKRVIIEVVAVLVTNALEATLDGRCGRVHVFASATDDRLRVVVEDGGEGFEPGTPLFEPGVTTRGAQRGFGLHSAANLVVGLGGQITLDSGGPGHGATATVDVPLGGRVSCAA